MTIEDQRDQWRRTFTDKPDFLGAEPSEPARAALARFEAAGVHELLELGPGQGRDTLFFLAAGLRVTALDYAETGLGEIAAKAASAGAEAAEGTAAEGGALRTVVADVREPLPLEAGGFDAVYAHMLFCMALSTEELVRLAAETRRVLRPGGLVVYTVRTTADAHYGVGIDHGDDRFEMGGFIVHFFDRALIDRLAAGFEVLDVAEYEEGRLPRRLAAVTMRRVEARETIGGLLERARSRLARLEPEAARSAQERGALLIDTRSTDLRRATGVIPGSVHVPLSVLFWRLDPTSESSDPGLTDLDRQVVLVCAHGYSSSLAAATLQDLGFRRATDVAGGFEAWAAAGLPVVKPHAD